MNVEDNELKTSDSILKKCTNLLIFIVKIVVLISIIWLFEKFIVQLVECINLEFSHDILEFILYSILNFTFIHLFIYLICYLFSKKYNFVKINIVCCILCLLEIISDLLFTLLFTLLF